MKEEPGEETEANSPFPSSFLSPLPPQLVFFGFCFFLGFSFLFVCLCFGMFVFKFTLTFSLWRHRSLKFKVDLF